MGCKKRDNSKKKKKKKTVYKMIENKIKKEYSSSYFLAINKRSRGAADL